MDGGLVGHGVQSVVEVGPLVLAAPVAAAAGLVTFLSPCCLPLVPGYLAYVTGMAGSEAQRAGGGRAAGKGRRGSAVAGTLLFVLGFSAVFVSFGAAFGEAGNSLLEHQKGLCQILGALTVLLGLAFVGVFERIPLFSRGFRPSWRPRIGLAGAPMLGVLFAISWTPCIGPTLASVLGLSMSSGSTGVRGAFLAFCYSLGIGIPFVLAAIAIGRTMRLVSFARRHARGVGYFGGALLVLVGVLQVSGLWNVAIDGMRTWMASYTPSL